MKHIIVKSKTNLTADVCLHCYRFPLAENIVIIQTYIIILLQTKVTKQPIIRYEMVEYEKNPTCSDVQSNT